MSCDTLAQFDSIFFTDGQPFHFKYLRVWDVWLIMVAVVQLSDNNGAIFTVFLERQTVSFTF